MQVGEESRGAQRERKGMGLVYGVDTSGPDAKPAEVFRNGRAQPNNSLASNGLSFRYGTGPSIISVGYDGRLGATSLLYTYDISLSPVALRPKEKPATGLDADVGRE